MLEKIKNQENVIMVFFVVTLVSVGTYVVMERDVIDVIYLGVLMYYFVRFLRIRKNGK
ncbi:MAG: hypothetical protein IJ509_01810 [Bacilli bacterium]|nr:hypothetical protein [Bacilli bacterium]